MTEKTEKRAKDRVSQIVSLYGKYNPLYTFCPMTMGFGESGHPDRFVLIYGVMIGIEVKKDVNNHHNRPELKAKPNEVMQKRQAEKITKAGGEWICVHNDNLHELGYLLDRHAKTPHSEFIRADQQQLSKLIGQDIWDI